MNYPTDNEWHPCTPLESGLLTAMTFAFAVSPFVAILIGMVA